MILNQMQTTMSDPVHPEFTLYKKIRLFCNICGGAALRRGVGWCCVLFKEITVNYRQFQMPVSGCYSRVITVVSINCLLL